MPQLTSPKAAQRDGYGRAVGQNRCGQAQKPGLEQHKQQGKIAIGECLQLGNQNTKLGVGQDVLGLGEIGPVHAEQAGQGQGEEVLWQHAVWKGLLCHSGGWQDCTCCLLASSGGASSGSNSLSLCRTQQNLSSLRCLPTLTWKLANAASMQSVRPNVQIHLDAGFFYQDDARPVVWQPCDSGCRACKPFQE